MDVSTAWNNTYTRINASVTDPIIATRTSPKWIYGAFPDVFAKDFNGFPMIVITPFSQKEDIVTLKNDTKRKEYVSDIEVISKSSKECDDLVTSVISALETVTGLNLEKVEHVGYRQIPFGGKRLHVRNVISRWVTYD